MDINRQWDLRKESALWLVDNFPSLKCNGPIQRILRGPSFSISLCMSWCRPGFHEPHCRHCGLKPKGAGFQHSPEARE